MNTLLRTLLSFFDFTGYFALLPTFPSEASEETDADTREPEDDCQFWHELVAMNPHLKRRNSKRFVIGDGEDDPSVSIPEMTITEAAADERVRSDWISIDNNKLKVRATLTILHLSGPSKMSISGYTCIRFVFCWVNVLFWISGCGLLGVGIWLRIAYEGYASLLPQYALLSADSLAIAFGTITFIFSFFACCGSWFQNKCMLVTYFVLVVFIFVAEFMIGALAFIYRESLKHTLREELRDGLLHHYNMTSQGPNSLVHIWDNIQSKFGCCGIENYEDWYMIDAWPDEKWVPDSCCLPASYDLNCGRIKDSGLYVQGCFGQIYSWFLQRLDIIGVVGLMVAFIQLYGLISSMLLFCTVKHKRTSRTYKSYS